MRLQRRPTFTRAPTRGAWLRYTPPAGGSSTLTETFTGADGSGSSGWNGWVPYTGGSSAQGIVGNRWRITGGGGFAGGAMSYTAATYGDVSFAITMTNPTGAQNNYPGLGVRIGGNHNGWDDTYCEGHNGYHAWYDQANNNLHLSQMTGGVYDNEITSATLSPAFQPNLASVRLRLEATGTTVRFKAWDPAGAEPGTWDLSTTYTGYSTGYIGFRQQPNDGGTFTFFDDAAWTIPAVGGRLKVYDGSAWNLKPTKVWSGSAWAEKPVKVWDGASWVLA